MLNLGTDEIAKYPFLAEAGQYLRDKGFTLDQFGTDPDLEPIIDKAFKRIETAATGKIYRSEITNLEEL
ncbi:MAG: DNA primase, partial [Nitrosopumilaceae archaeon]